MSGYRGNRRPHFGKSSGRRGKDSDVNKIDESNPIVQCFREYAAVLDAKHDKYERIVKISRDITIESKRIIFLLHTIDPRKNNLQKVCDEAKARLDNIIRNHFVGIAKELEGQDPYQYSRAYTNGMQEFIEAYTFYKYSNGQDISQLNAIQQKLRYDTSSNANVQSTELVAELGNTEPATSSEGNADLAELPASDDAIKMQCFIHPQDFILGLGDLSGEIMRKCINSLGSGNSESCFEHCRFMQELYKGFLSVTSARNRDFSHKMVTLRQSLLKSENVCYNVTVRGGEAAKWGSTDEASAGVFQFQPTKDDDDEGVFF